MATAAATRRSSVATISPPRNNEKLAAFRRSSCYEQVSSPPFVANGEVALQLLGLLNDYALRRESNKTIVSPVLTDKIAALLSSDSKGRWASDFSFGAIQPRLDDDDDVPPSPISTCSTVSLARSDSLSSVTTVAQNPESPKSLDVEDVTPLRSPALPHSSELLSDLAPILVEVVPPSELVLDTPTVCCEKPALPSPSRWTTMRSRCKAWLQTHYLVIDADPALLLASPPTDDEKIAYSNSHRVVLCGMALITFLCSSAGIWMFIVCGSMFYWFAAFFVVGQMAFALFQLSSAMAKGFSLQQHDDVVRANAIATTDTCPKEKLDRTPTVDVFLPCCKEPLDVLENTYTFVQKLQYPKSRLQVHILDDGKQDEVRDLAYKYDYNYIRRNDGGHLKKAGNLRNAFAQTSGDYFFILDADFCPRADFLQETIPRMLNDTTIGILQTPQYFRSIKDVGMQTWVERGAGATQEVFYRLIQTCRDTWGAVICAGSCAVYRRAAVQKLGGTAPLESSEDIFTGFYITLDGWKVRYLPLNLSCGICPNTARAYYSQQLRWCEGSCSLVLSKQFWVSALNWKAKVLYVSGLLYYVDHAFAPFVMPLAAILLIWFKISALTIYNLAFAIPSIIFGYWLARFWSTAKHAKSVQFVNVVQSYAYTSALLDRVLGTTYAWVPSGDAKAQKSQRYRTSRWLCIGYTFATTTALGAGIVYQVNAGHHLYLFAPIIALQLFTLHTTLPFMLARH